MKRLKLNTFEIIKYILLFILATLSIYLILLTHHHITKIYPPKNSIEVSLDSNKSTNTIESLNQNNKNKK